MTCDHREINVNAEIIVSVERFVMRLRDYGHQITFQTEKIRLVEMPSKCINRMFCVINKL
jgi:hypothetical protein